MPRLKPWKRVEPTRRHATRFRVIIGKTFRMGSGEEHVFDTFGEEGQQHAGCVAITKDKQAIVVRQFRAGPELIMDEIPGGNVEQGEDPQAAAVRELEEEAGYRPGKVTYLGKAYKDAYMNATWHFYLAVDCEPVAAGQKLDETEDVELDLVSIDQLIKNAKTGKMTDSIAVFMAYDQLQKLR